MLINICVQCTRSVSRGSHTDTPRFPFPVMSPRQSHALMKFDFPAGIYYLHYYIYVFGILFFYYSFRFVSLIYNTQYVYLCIVNKERAPQG